MINLSKEIKKFSKIMVITAHPDDESYLFSGLIQVTKRNKNSVYLLCLTKGEKSNIFCNTKGLSAKTIRETELKQAVSFLKIDSFDLFDFGDSSLMKNFKFWLPEVEKKIKEFSPNTIITYDQSGVTGHSDHIAISKGIKSLSFGKKVNLFLRVPDKREKNHFRDKAFLKYSMPPTHRLDYTFSEALKKIKSILIYKSQVRDFYFKMKIYDWHLFHHHEYYAKAN